jgi:hypothetical protein
MYWSKVGILQINMKANSVREVKKHLFNINNIVDEGGDNNKGVAGVLKDRAGGRVT